MASLIRYMNTLLLGFSAMTLSTEALAQQEQVEFLCQAGGHEHNVTVKVASIHRMTTFDGQIMLRAEEVDYAPWHGVLLEQLAAIGVGEDCARVVVENSEIYVQQANDDSQVMYVYFDFDKANLTSQARQALNSRLALLTAAEPVIISGHTDNVGTRKYNLNLGLARAETVQQYLLSHGASEKAIMIESYGESAPVMDNRDSSGRQKNRRVAIKWLIEP